MSFAPSMPSLPTLARFVGCFCRPLEVRFAAPAVFSLLAQGCFDYQGVVSQFPPDHSVFSSTVSECHFLSINSAIHDHESRFCLLAFLQFLHRSNIPTVQDFHLSVKQICADCILI